MSRYFKISIAILAYCADSMNWHPLSLAFAQTSVDQSVDRPDSGGLLDIITAAETASANIASQRKTIEVRELDAAKSSSDYLPTVSFSGSASRKDREGTLTIPGAPGSAGTEVVTSPRDEYSAMVQIDAPILDLNRFRSTQLANTRSIVAQVALRSEILALEVEVSAKWLEVVKARLGLQVAAKSLALALETLATTERRVISGSALATDTARAKALVLEARANVAVREAEIAAGEARIRLATGGAFSGSESLPGETFLAAIDRRDLETWIAEAVTKDPLVAEADARVAEAKAQISVSNATLYPVLNLFAAHDLARSDILTAPPKNQIGINASWKLGVSDSYARKSSAASASAASEAVRGARDRAKDAIIEAWHGLTVAKRRFEAADARVLSAEQDRIVREQQLRSGTATALVFAETVTKLFEAANGRSVAFVDVIAKRITLAHASGQSLRAFTSSNTGESN